MFLPEDYIEIFEYLRYVRFVEGIGGVTPEEPKDYDSMDELDNNIKVIAKSEQIKVTQLFQNTIDQVAFLSNDYKRLKFFLIDWYATHRIITTLQKNPKDPFSLPKEHLDELLLSFGADYSIDVAFLNKAYFFLDLVNLYKIKGTPLAIQRIMSYYGFPSVDVAEYWVERNSDLDIVFKGESVFDENSADWPEVPFETMVANDPHWMLTKTEIENAIENNSVAIPSKSPYFGLRPRYDINDLTPVFALISRKVKDYYDEYISTGIAPPRTIKISQLNYSVSFLELYLSTLYVYNQHFQRTDEEGSDSTTVFYYDGTNTDNIDEFIEEYNEIVTPITNTRSEREEKFQEFLTRYTGDTYEIHRHTYSSGEILEELYPAFKDDLDIWLGNNRGLEILTYLLLSISDWIQTNINPEYASIIGLMIGMSSYDDLTKALNFFKPYHSRLVFVQESVVVDNPLLDSIRLEDSFTSTEATITIIDIPKVCDTCILDSTECHRNEYVMYDCGDIHDAAIASDEFYFDMTADPFIDPDSDAGPDYLNFHREELDATATIYSEYTLEYDSTDAGAAEQTAGFVNFDEGYYFDSPHGSDIFNVYAQFPTPFVVFDSYDGLGVRTMYCATLGPDGNWDIDLIL